MIQIDKKNIGSVFFPAEKRVSEQNLRLEEKRDRNKCSTKETSCSYENLPKKTRPLSLPKSFYQLNPKGIMSFTHLNKTNTFNFSDYTSQTENDWGINMEDETDLFESFKINNLSELSIYDNSSDVHKVSCLLNQEKKNVELLSNKTTDKDEKDDIQNIKNFDTIKSDRFRNILQETNVDLNILKKHAWNGIPDEFRPIVWKLLMGYLPCNAERREATLFRKRNEYLEIVSQTYRKGIKELDQATWHQIHIDVLRTNPTIKLYQYETTQKCLERILYVWVIRHPASGYVQGISDLVTPFFQVFLSAYIDSDPETYDPSNLSKDTLDIIEADTFWCISKLLDSIQDNYIFAQPGIHRQIMNLKELTTRINHQLSAHFEKEGVEYIQFSFRWMNCMLMREMSVKNTIRMWDTYIAEGQSGFSDFHVYVCAAFLVKWSSQLLKMDFQEIIIFLQSLPTQHWTYKDIEILLSEAFLWKSLFSGAKAHLR